MIYFNGRMECQSKEIKKNNSQQQQIFLFEMSWVLKLLDVVVISDDNLICFSLASGRDFFTPFHVVDVSQRKTCF